MEKDQRDVDEYLARIRKTIEASNNMVSQVELRIAETDRMLERQGLTRDQVMAMRFTEAQLEAVNDELARRGMTPLERWEADDEPAEPAERYAPPPDPGMSGEELENRQRKFGMMMKPFQI